MGNLDSIEIDDLADQFDDRLNVQDDKTQGNDENDDDKNELEVLAEKLQSGKAKRIMVLSGAG